jgi:rubrerythrin
MGMFEVDGADQPTRRGSSMGARAETTEDAALPLAAGVKAKGEYRCEGCGYGVTIYRELPLCPMCGADSWLHIAWSPFTRAPAGVAELH